VRIISASILGEVQGALVSNSATLIFCVTGPGQQKLSLNLLQVTIRKEISRTFDT